MNEQHDQRSRVVDPFSHQRRAPMQHRREAPSIASVTPLHIALGGLLLSVVVNFGGIAYYSNKETRTNQTLHELTVQVEKLRPPPQPPVKAVSDDLKYLIATFRAIERMEPALTAIKDDLAAFRKVVEPKLEKLEQRRR